jgi:hypothetical protein
MRFIFIVVEIEDSVSAIPLWRATCASEDLTVDMWFYAQTLAEAKAHVRKKYPAATFSDE